MTLKLLSRIIVGRTPCVRKGRARIRSICSGALVFLAFSGALYAQSGLDPSFDGDGIAITSMAAGGTSRASDLVVQPDGKIVVVGWVGDSFEGGIIAIARYNTDGSLDATFDGDGKVTTPFPIVGFGAAYAVRLQADGKIVVAGRHGAMPSVGNPDAVVLRYNTDGSLDSTFDGDGYRILVFTTQSGWELASDLLVQPDGKIVVIGQTAGVEPSGGLTIVRLNGDASFDTSFGTGGVVRIPGQDSAGIDMPKLAMGPDGKLEFTGLLIAKVLGRLNSDGTADTSFGTAGIVNNARGDNLVVQPDGKIIIVNSTSQVDLTVKRFNTNGTPDTSFGTGGSSVVPFTNADGNLKPPYDIALQTDGKIVLGGTIKLTTQPDRDFAVARLNANGSLDSFFGFNGRITTNVNGWDIGRGVLVQSDGKIVLTGESLGGFSLARYLAGSLANPCRPVSDFDGDGKSDLAYYTNAGEWKYTPTTTGGLGTLSWGLPTDIIVPADYTGDCRTDFAVYRDGTWYIKPSGSASPIYYQFGLAGDIPVPADYDGDDLADPAVYRNGIWYVLGSREGFFAVQWGLAGDNPAPGDYDGDGKDDLAVYRAGVWYLLQSNLGFGAFPFGVVGDKPVVGDYDGDHKTDAAVYRPSDGTWYLLQSQAGFAGVRWGIASDRPVPADYDGDGKTDIAVYRNGDWYLLQSTSGYQLKQFGGSSDRPVQGAYVP